MRGMIRGYDEELKHEHAAYIDIISRDRAEHTVRPLRGMHTFKGEDITCSYRKSDGSTRQVLHNVSMEVKRREMVAIIGRGPSLLLWLVTTCILVLP